MSFLIDLPPSVEARIEQDAQQAGISPSELVTEILHKNFTTAHDQEEQKRLNPRSITLLQSWLAETEKPRMEVEAAQLVTNMDNLMRNQNSTWRETGERLHFSENQ